MHSQYQPPGPYIPKNLQGGPVIQTNETSLKWPGPLTIPLKPYSVTESLHPYASFNISYNQPTSYHENIIIAPAAEPSDFQHHYNPHQRYQLQQHQQQLMNQYQGNQYQMNQINQYQINQYQPNHPQQQLYQHQRPPSYSYQQQPHPFTFQSHVIPILQMNHRSKKFMKPPLQSPIPISALAGNSISETLTGQETMNHYDRTTSGDSITGGGAHTNPARTGRPRGRPKGSHMGRGNDSAGFLGLGVIQGGSGSVVRVGGMIGHGGRKWKRKFF